MIYSDEKKFGQVSVIIERSNLLDELKEHKIKINWNCSGGVSTKEASDFFNDFWDALRYAREKEWLAGGGVKFADWYEKKLDTDKAGRVTK